MTHRDDSESREHDTDDFSADLAPWRRRALGWLINFLAPFWLATLALNYFLYAQRPTDTESSSTVVWSFLIVSVVMGALSRNGQQPGHVLMKVQVVDTDGQPIGRVAQIVRSLAHSADWFAVGIGWLWPLWDSKAQTFADKLARTRVVNVAL